MGAPELVAHDTDFRVGDTHFRIGFGSGTSAESFWIRKDPDMINDYRRLLPEFDGGNVVELGIHDGGSTALIASVIDVRRLVALDLTAERSEALDEFSRSHGLDEKLHAHYGFDQADRPRLRRLVHEEFDGEPLDLVIDDASHLYPQTRASFEVLFPLVRPGGLYIVEDWAWEYQTYDHTAVPVLPEHQAMADAMQAMLPHHTGRDPLVKLALELTMARASYHDAVGEVTISAGHCSVRRGPAPLDPDAFSLSDLYRDHCSLLRAFDGPTSPEEAT